MGDKKELKKFSSLSIKRIYEMVTGNKVQEGPEMPKVDNVQAEINYREQLAKEAEVKKTEAKKAEVKEADTTSTEQETGKEEDLEI